MTRIIKVAVVALLAAAPAVLPGGSAQAQRAEWAYDRTEEIVNARDGEVSEATVRVSQTTNLFDRQSVEVELAGFRPTRNPARTENTGLTMEYPVVVMQCRGIDPTPATCLNERRSVWFAGYDAGAPADLAERARRLSGPESMPGAASPKERLTTQQLAFDAVGGVSYLWFLENGPDGKPVVDEPALENGLPPDAAANPLATRSIPVQADGTAEFTFEARERVSQASLGCTDRLACSMVVVPIMDMACAADAPSSPTSDQDCADPALGSPTGAGSEYNPWLGPRTWFAHSNWENRFVVPLGFAPDPEQCDIRDPRPTLPLYGSELVDVAQQRWGLAYCEGARRASFLPSYTQGSEYSARAQFTTKTGPRYGQDAVVTTEPILDSPRPVAHAPSAITGFTVAYTVDDAVGNQYEELTLSPRLLAKLLTESYNPLRIGTSIKENRELYTGQPITSDDDARLYYWDHPAIGSNPHSLFDDEEFLALNPNLLLRDPDGPLSNHLTSAETFPVTFTVRSDIIMDLTRYVLSDPAARAWLNGEPDEQGMVVNPVWRGMAAFEGYNLRDTETQPRRPRRPGWYETNNTTQNYFNLVGAGTECNDASPTPLLTLYSNVTNSAEFAATALLDRRGSATPLCTVTDVAVPEGQQRPPQFAGDNPATTRFYTLSKEQPKDFGKRAQLAVTTVAHAELYEMPTARLVNAGGQAVAPTRGTMVNALAAADQDPVTGTVLIDHARLRGNAYPGTMLAFTAAPTLGLDMATADRYADYIEFMATDGQTPGDSLTNLPPGYDPLTPNLRKQALDAARAVREQRGEVPAPPPGGPLGGVPEGTGGPGTGDGPGGGPGAGAPASSQGAAPESREDDPDTVAQTKGEESWLSRWAFPLLLAFGALAALAAAVVQVASRPDHPVRRAIGSVLNAVVRR